MKKIPLFIFVFICLFWLTAGYSGGSRSVSSAVPLGCDQETGLSSKQGLADMPSGIPSGATAVLLQAETQNVRWRDDGPDPTASVGMRLLVGELLFYTGDLTAIEFFEEAASAKVNACFYR